MPGMAFQEMHLFRADKRMHQRFKPRQRHRIAEHGTAQFLPIKAMQAGRAGKQPLDSLKRPPARTLKRAHGSIGIEDRHAEAAKHGGNRRFAHADRSGQAKHDHAKSLARSSASCWRGAGAP